MHELSIAMSLVDLVEDAVADAGAIGDVAVVTVRVGAFSGVVAEALEFAWGSASEGTRCEGSRLEIERTPGRVRCPGCGGESELEFPPVFVCLHCGCPTAEVISGRELDLLRLEVHEDPPAADQETSHAAQNP